MAKLTRILILGGTREASQLAARVEKRSDMDVILSLAGRTEQPVVSSENTRVGGFGGVVGLTNYLSKENIDLIVDATHPFAAQISFHAVAAALETGIPHIMLIRPAWEPIAGDRWLEADNNQTAATVLAQFAQRIFLAIGRQELAAFAHLQNRWFLMRMIDPPVPDALLPRGKILLERGPFSLEAERSLLQEHEIDVIVCKNSGGSATYAKIRAARELQIPVVMIQRPSTPDCQTVETVEDALIWIEHQLKGNAKQDDYSWQL